MQVQPQPFLTAALYGGRLSASRPGPFIPGKEPRNAWNKRLKGSGLFRDDKKLLPLPGFEPRTVQPIA